MPFDIEDAMFNPPLPGSRQPAYDYDTNSANVPVVYHDAPSIVPDVQPPAGKPPRKASEKGGERGKKGEGKKTSNTDKHHGRGPHKHLIIPPEEDMRRLFQECKVGMGNATLMSQALAMVTPEKLTTSVITEFHKKCIDSQELIFTQIPWASARAERSRAAMDQEERERERKRKNSTNTLNSLVPNAFGPDTNGSVPDLLDTPLSTREEELLADLLEANEALLEALKLFDDLSRVAIEREAEDRSRKEVRMDPRQRQFITEDGTLYADAPGGAGGAGSSRSRSPSPSPARGPVQHPLPSHPQVVGAAAELTFQAPSAPALQAQQQQTLQAQQALQTPVQQQQTQTLGPPPAAPRGPRLPARS
ncbi:hypothetical protein C8R44DRAFT_4115 [Mycena epipterygia]|nr:hypothetical protein C8R44DRAFT_4115 [Mycena epipterygia]